MDLYVYIMITGIRKSIPFLNETSTAEQCFDLLRGRVTRYWWYLVLELASQKPAAFSDFTQDMWFLLLPSFKDGDQCPHAGRSAASPCTGGPASQQPGTSSASRLPTLPDEQAGMKWQRWLFITVKWKTGNAKNVSLCKGWYFSWWAE